MGINHGPRVRPDSDFATAAEVLDDNVRFMEEFNAFTDANGLGATSDEQQREMARLHAKVAMSHPDFDKGKYHHQDRDKNQKMIIALYYWRLFKEQLPADEEKRRRDEYLSLVPPTAKVRTFGPARINTLRGKKP